MLKKTSFNALKKLTPQERVKSMESSVGPTVLSLLTPSQMADLFPRYYQRALPDISGFRAAVSQATQKQQADFQKTVADQLGIDPVTGRRKGGWLEKMGKKYGEGPHIPKLSSEQEKLMTRLNSGPVPIKEMGFLGSLSDAELKAARIEKYKDDKGVEYYRPVGATEQEAIESLKTGMAGKRYNVAQAAALARSVGATPEEAQFLGAVTKGESSGIPTKHNDNRKTGDDSYGLWQVNMLDSMGDRRLKQFGINRREDLYDVKINAKAALMILREQGRGAWGGYKDMQKRGEWDEAYRAAATGANGQVQLPGGPEKPEGPNNTYSKEQIESRISELNSTTISPQRMKEVAADLEKHGVSYDGQTVTVNKDEKFRTTKDGYLVPASADLYSPDNSRQCATLSKAMNPDIGRAPGWSVKTVDISNIKPGMVIASEAYNTGPSREGAGFHTGVVMDVDYKTGKVVLLDQFDKESGRPGLRTYDYNNYKGFKMGLIESGGKLHDEISAPALRIGSTLTSDERLKEKLTSRYNSVINQNEISQTGSEKIAKVEPKQVEQSVKHLPEETQKQVTESIQQTATVNKPAEKKATGPKSFNVNPDSFKEASIPEGVKRGYPEMLVRMADPNEFRDGFNKSKEAKAAGAFIDENWKMTVKNADDPKVKDLLEQYKGNVLTEIKDKQAAAEAKTQTASVGEKLQREFGVASAQAQELDLSDPNVRAAIKAQHERGMKSNLIDYQNSKTGRALGMSNEEYTAFRKAITGIESGGGDWKNMKYNIRGGSSNRFSGAYQMGSDEIKNVAKRLGEEAPVMKMGRKTVANEKFLNDPHMQERYFDEYMLSHHESLLRRNKKYANMSPEQQRHALAISHNAGAGGASRWINTGKTKADAFKTDPKNYGKALDQQFAELKAQQEQKTQVAAAQPVSPIQEPTKVPSPEPSFFEKAKSAAESSLGLKSASAETKPSTSAPSAPEFPKTPKTGETPTPPQRPMEISPVKQAQELGKPDESSTKKFLESEGIGKKEAEQIPAKAYGGDVEASQEVSAYPINGLRGDNTLAVDTKTQQPLFTFNPGKEAVVPNGENNSASVIPTNKITGSFEGQKQTSVINELNSMKMQMQDMMQNVGKPDVRPPAGEREVPVNNNPNFLENILQQPRTPYQNPTFYRAMSRAKGFAETGDAVDGNHYSWGNRI